MSYIVVGQSSEKTGTNVGKESVKDVSGSCVRLILVHPESSRWQTVLTYMRSVV